MKLNIKWIGILLVILLMSSGVISSKPKKVEQTPAVYSNVSDPALLNTALKLRDLGVLPESQQLDLVQALSRAEFAKVLATVFLLSIPEEPVFIADVDFNLPEFVDIQTVVSNKVFTLDKDQLFFPEREMIQASALVALTRAANLTVDTNQKSFEPVDGVSPNHWVMPYLAAAIDADIVSKNEAFYPNAPFTRYKLLKWIAPFLKQS